MKTIYIQYVIPYQIKLVKIRAEPDNPNHCAAPPLSRAAVNLCWYYYICITRLYSLVIIYQLNILQ